MVKTKGPLFSLEAHGKLANLLNYSGKKTGSQVRKFHYPKKKVTGAQWTQRHIIGMLTARWQVMTDDEKTPYLVSARIANPVITGFNYFIRVAQADLKTHLGLELYFPFNNIVGATVPDASGNKNDGTLQEDYPTKAPVQIQSFKEQYGKALSFNGVDQYISTGKKFENVFQKPFSISIWFNPATPSAVKQIIGGFKYPYDNAARVEWRGDGPKQIRCTYNSNAGTKVDLYTEALKNEKWQQVFWTVSRSLSKIYIDGEFKLSGDMSGQVMEDFVGEANFNIGFIFSCFYGFLDEAKLFNREVSAEEVKKHYNLLRLNKKRQPHVKH